MKNKRPMAKKRSNQERYQVNRNQVEAQGIIFKLKDSAMISEWNDSNSMGQIKQILDDKVIIMWYYKPLDVCSSQLDFFSEAELFKSNHIQEVYIESLYDKIEVLSLKEYHQRDEVEHNVFFTRAKYDIQTKQLDPPIEQWSRVCTCAKILNPDLQYIICDNCEEEFHIECYPDVEKFECPNCGCSQ